MPKRYFCTFIKFVAYKKQMLQTANTDPFYPLSLKITMLEYQILPFPFQIKPEKGQLKRVCGFFIFCTLGTDGLTASLASLKLAI